MNRSLIAALLAVTALSGGVAWADPNDDHPGGGHPQGQQGQGQHGQGQHGQGQQGHGQQGRGQQGQGQQGQGGPAAQAQHQPRDQHQPQAQVQPRPQARIQRQNGAAARGDGFTYGGARHQRIRGPGYSYPQGYSYRHWGIGQDLPLLFLNSAYFFDGYADYGIGPPPYGFRWVRYGPDLLLVSTRTGRIRQVIYDAFY